MGRRTYGVTDVQFGCRQADAALGQRVEGAMQNAADQERPVHRIRRLAGLEHLLDVRGQTGGVLHIRTRTAQKLRGDDPLRSLKFRGEQHVPHRPVEQQQRRLQAVSALDDPGVRVVDDLRQHAAAQQILRSGILQVTGRADPASIGNPSRSESATIRSALP